MRRAEVDPNGFALVSGEARTTFRGLVERVENLASLFEMHFGTSNFIELSGNPSSQVVGVLAAMLARRSVILGCVDEASNALIVDRVQDFPGSGALDVRGIKHRLGDSVEGFSVVVPTSGTTGRPKLVVHNDESLAGSLILTTSVEDELDGDSGLIDSEWSVALVDLAARDPHGLRFLSAMPITSISGLSMMLRSIAMGEMFVVPQSLEPQAVWDSVVDCQVTNVGLPPFTAARFASLAANKSLTHPELLHIGIGGSFVDPELVEKLEERLGCTVTIGYGSTELGGVAIMSRPWDSLEIRSSTIGRPVHGVEIRLNTVESGSELVVKSPSMALGVLNDDGLSPHVQWFSTGDLATTTSTGELIIGGRADFMISRGSRRIDPARIEAVIERHEMVDRAAVLGVPSRVAGNQDIVAFISAKSDLVRDGILRDLTTEIREHCIQRLPIHEVPRRIKVVDEIALCVDFTLDRRRIRDQFSHL